MADVERAVKAIRAAIHEEERRRLPHGHPGTLARDMYVLGLRTALALLTAPDPAAILGYDPDDPPA